MSVYLDYNATAPVRPEAEAAVLQAMRIGGNPSSIHANGRAARALVEAARQQVADLVGVKVGSVTFTSGGTEANVLALESAVARGSRRLIVLATEHDSVLQAAMAIATAEVWAVDERGVADLAWLERRLANWDAADGAPFVALALANNETGVIQPVDEVAKLVREAGGWLHVDAVQAAGKIALDFTALGADTLSLSAHKLGGLPGSGALIAGARATLTRKLHGGGQERGRRAGTENVPGIAAFGAVAQASRDDQSHQAAWRDAVQARLVAEAGIVPMGDRVLRLPQTLCFAAPGFASQMQVMQLDLAGVMVSAGAACSSGKVTPSRVLTAMDHAAEAPFALRVSGGWATTEADWRAFADAWLSAWSRYNARHFSYRGVA